MKGFRNFSVRKKEKTTQISEEENFPTKFRSLKAFENPEFTSPLSSKLARLLQQFSGKLEKIFPFRLTLFIIN